MTSSIAELRAQGITFEAKEAVAITQQLISAFLDHRDADEVQPPYGPPSADNVVLSEDGTVACRGCQATPAVSEVGIFLDALLQDGSARVPGGLRYTIARALLDVDVPPFDSLDDLSRDLARHEHGDRAATVRGVLTRATGQTAVAISRRPAATSGLVLVDRRRGRSAAATSELRRALREAQTRLYETQSAMAPPIDVIAVPPRDRTLSAAAACLAAGLMLIGTGELMYRRDAPVVLPPPAPAIAQSTFAAPPLAPPSDMPERGIIIVRDGAPAAARRVSIRRTMARPSATAVRRVSRAQQARPSRGVMDRLKLGWLRNAFTARSEL